MKQYTITVNGVAYDVTVEEGSGAAPAPAAAVAPAPKKPVEKKVAAGAAGSVKVTSPMQGKILAVNKKVGDAVKKGEPVAVLEAMKMENDIVAPEDGVIASINCAVGDTVEAGALLATLN